MDSIVTSINGSENFANVENDKLKILINFYKAFNQRDMRLMQSVWLNSDEVSMNNPLGGIMRGWKDIENVYNKIFNGKAKVYVEFYEFTIHSVDNMFFATGRERGFFKKGDISVDLFIRTSRVFTKVNGDWKHIQHHGSIDDPDLLKKYQDAILKN